MKNTLGLKILIIFKWFQIVYANLISPGEKARDMAGIKMKKRPDLRGMDGTGTNM